MTKKRDYVGILAAPIVLPSLGPLEFEGAVTPEREKELRDALERREAMFNEKLEAEFDKRIAALFGYFGVQEGDWCSLALELAAKYVPGFQRAPTRRGAPRLWDDARLKKLLAECKGINPEGDISDRQALRRLMKHEDWAPPKGRSESKWLETLESRLQDAKSWERLVAFAQNDFDAVKKLYEGSLDAVAAAVSLPES